MPGLGLTASDAAEEMEKVLTAKTTKAKPAKAAASTRAATGRVRSTEGDPADSMDVDEAAFGGFGEEDASPSENDDDNEEGGPNEGDESGDDEDEDEYDDDGDREGSEPAAASVDTTPVKSAMPSTGGGPRPGVAARDEDEEEEDDDDDDDAVDAALRGTSAADIMAALTKHTPSASAPPAGPSRASAPRGRGGGKGKERAREPAASSSQKRFKRTK